MTDFTMANAEDFYRWAEAHLGQGDHTAVLSAVEERLSKNPRELAANLVKAQALLEARRLKSAASFFQASLSLAQTQFQDQPFTRSGLEAGQRFLQNASQLFQDQLCDHLKTAGLKPDDPGHHRVAHAVDVMLGRKQMFHPAPSVFFFPSLPVVEFSPTYDFPWTESLEGQTDVVEKELDGLVASQLQYEPYIGDNPDAPVLRKSHLQGDDGWGAFHLYQQGVPVKENIERCPQTMALLETLDLPKLAGRGPNILFSRLKPGMHIPPHHGQTNCRYICHLPLKVPTGAWIRVGSEKRFHQRGEILAFDDSIEHEAKNDSQEDRVVLIFDVWRPELTQEERRLVQELFSAVDMQV